MMTLWTFAQKNVTENIHFKIWGDVLNENNELKKQGNIKNSETEKISIKKTVSEEDVEKALETLKNTKRAKQILNHV